MPTASHPLATEPSLPRSVAMLLRLLDLVRGHADDASVDGVALREDHVRFSTVQRSSSPSSRSWRANPAGTSRRPSTRSEALGVEVEFGPFGTKCTTASTQMPDVVAAIIGAAFANGATHVSIHVTALEDAGRMSAEPHPLLRAVKPVVDAVGATLVPPDQREPERRPAGWDGQVVAAVRMPPLHGALDRLIDAVETELGGRLPVAVREDKQRAVRLLDERGAFTLRRAVEQVADAMGVSRITVYNYLNAIHR